MNRARYFQFMSFLFSCLYTFCKHNFFSLTHSQLPKMIGYRCMQIWKPNALTHSISSFGRYVLQHIICSDESSSCHFFISSPVMDPANDNEQSSHESSNIDEAGPEQQDLSPQQQAERELLQQYQQQVDPRPKGKDGLHHYFGGQPLINPPFWAVQYQLDSELKKFSPIDDQETGHWLTQHDPAYPDNISLKNSTLGTLYFERILLGTVVRSLQENYLGCD